MHLKLYSFSENDYKQSGLIWNGPHPEDGQECVVVEGAIPGHTSPDLEEEPQLNAPPVPTILTRRYSPIWPGKWALSTTTEIN